MKTLIIFAGLCAIAYAADDHSVRIAPQPDQGAIVVNNPDPAYSRPSNGGGINILPDNAFYRPTSGNGYGANYGHVQPGTGSTYGNTGGRPYPPKPYDPGFSPPSNGGGVNIYPDNAFYQPTSGNGYDGGYGHVQPGTGPTYVNPGGRPYPPKPYDNPLARGGK